MDDRSSYYRPGDSLLGTFEGTIDAEGWVTLPSQFRFNLAGSVLTRGFDRCLHLLTAASWQSLADGVCSISPGIGAARSLRRLMFAGAAEVTLDTRGRLAIPHDLRMFAELHEQVVFVGLYTYIELWSYERWQPIVESFGQQSSALAATYALSDGMQAAR